MGIRLHGELYRKDRVVQEQGHMAATTDRDFLRPVANGLAPRRMQIEWYPERRWLERGPRLSHARWNRTYARLC